MESKNLSNDLSELQNDNLTNELSNDIHNRRKTLKSKHPYIYDKLINFLNGEKTIYDRKVYLIDFAYRLDCNFTCEHCCATVLKNQTEQLLTIEDAKNIADQADELGVFVFSIIGGEPLVWHDLDQLVEAINPKRFFVSITTNGFLLSKKMAQHLVDIGVSKVNISIDSYFEEEHDLFRNKPGSYKKAMEGIINAREAGLNVQVSTVATHENVYSDSFLKLLAKTSELNIGHDIQVATPSGNWLGNTDALMNENDVEYLSKLRETFPLLRRDVYPTPDALGGCPAVKNSLYIIPNGEVLPCIFIHISLGNVLKEPLGLIRERGMNIPQLNEFSKVCLAGESCEFFDKYIRNTFNKKGFPLSFSEGFYDISLDE